MAIEVGQSVSFPFAGKSMQGTVVQLHAKSVVIRADFPNHKGKVVRRKIHDLGDKPDAKAKGGLVERFRARRKKAKAEKAAAAKQAAKKAKATPKTPEKKAAKTESDEG